MNYEPKPWRVPSVNSISILNALVERLTPLYVPNVQLTLLEKSSEYRYRGSKRGGQKNDHPTKRNCAEQLLPLRSPFRMCQGRRGHPHMRQMRRGVCRRDRQSTIIV